MRDKRGPPVVVVGGGWAGLACAVELCRHRVPVLVLESARQLGGRARSFRDGDRVLDNGQHLITGACSALLSLLATLGLDESHCFERRPLELLALHPDRPALRLRAPALPAPFHLAAALARARGLGRRDRLRAVRFGARIKRLAQKAMLGGIPDIAVDALLRQEGQTTAAIERLWAPLCLATLNTAPDAASAHLYLRVLVESFHGNRHRSDLLFPRRPLSEIVPIPACRWLEDRGGEVRLGERVQELLLRPGRMPAVRCGDLHIEARAIVLATAPVMTRRLLEHDRRLSTLCRRLGQLSQETIITVYLQYPPGTTLPGAMVGLEQGPGQWAFDRSLCGQPGLLAVVVSAAASCARLDNQDLVGRVGTQLARLFPHWPAPRHARVIREKRATFSARPGVNTLRPDCRTPVEHLWLAGDYTATGLPATLEGAVRSGVHCATALMGEPGSRQEPTHP